MDLPEALATIDLLRGHIAVLEVQLSERDAVIAQQRLDIAMRDFDVDRLRRMLFGDRKESMTPEELTLPGLDLAGSNDNAAATVPEERQRVREHERIRRKARARLQVDPACGTTRHVTLLPASTTCRCCGEAMGVIGEETSTVTERIPARYEQVVTHRPKYACNRCRQGGVVIARPEDPPITGAGGVGLSLATDITVMHFADHLPFHRIAGILLREGLRIDRSTLSRVAERVARALAVVVEAMRAELVRGDGVVGIDGTQIKILAKRRCLRRTVYVLHGGGHAVFTALASGGAATIFAGFESFAGVVACDAATVHTGTHSQKLGLLLALCNAHGRRYFFDARATDAPRANHALRFFQEVARAEQRWRTLDPEARRRAREEELAPRFADFHAWLLAERGALTPRGPMAQAFDYALAHWEGLTRFLHDGRVPWTNNESERLLRHVVVGRKAWVFRGSFEGAERGCVLWSLMMSCRLHGIDPRRYLLDTLAALGDTPRSRAIELTPKAYAERQRSLERVA